MHFGAQYMRTEDGVWLQPEPLLYLGLTNGNLKDPLGYGPLFARGNSNRYLDLDGFTPLVARLALVWARAEAAMTWADYTATAVSVASAVSDTGSVGGAVVDVAATGAGMLLPGGGGAALRHSDTATGRVMRAAADKVDEVVAGACFVEGTEVQGTGGSLPIDEVRAGDRVLAAASTDGGETGWVKVESDADVRSAGWSPRGVCSRLAKVGRKAALPAMLVACDPAFGGCGAAQR